MLPYSESDICKLYRTALNKKYQIKILAEMNLTNKEEILGVLNRNGIQVDYDKLPDIKPMGGWHRTKAPKVSRDDRNEKYKEAERRGMTVSEAALFIGVSASQVRKYAKQHGLEFVKAKRGRKTCGGIRPKKNTKSF